jgi:hypothetical protein
MIRRMTLVRKTVTLPESVVRDIEELSDGNFSAFTAQALERAVRRSHLRAVVAELEAVNGPSTEEGKAAARAKLRG